MATPYVVVLVTVPDKKTAGEIGRALLTARLAACVNMLPEIASLYWWEGNQEQSREILLLIKTRAALVGELVSIVRSRHPYQVPEIVALPILQGNRPYLDWIGANTQFTKPKAPPKSARPFPFA